MFSTRTGFGTFMVGAYCLFQGSLLARHGMVAVVTGGPSQLGIVHSPTLQSGLVSVMNPSATQSMTGIAVAPDGLHAYVYSNANAAVSYIDLASGASIATIELPILIGVLGLNRNGSRLFIAGSAGTQSLFTVCMIDTSSNTLIQTTALPGTNSPTFINYQFGFSADGSKAYFPAPAPATEIYVLDAKSGGYLSKGNLPMAATSFASAAAVNHLVIALGDPTTNTATVMILNAAFQIVKQLTFYRAHRPRARSRLIRRAPRFT